MGAGFWGALAGLGWRSFWGLVGALFGVWACSSWLGAGAALFMGLWVLVGTRGLSLGLLPCGRMWALACGRKCCGRFLGERVSACGRMWALLGGCDECLWALVGAGAFLMKCCAAGCERIQALARSASLMGACERTWACGRLWAPVSLGGS